MIIQDTTTDHHCQVGPWAQEERGLLPGAGQECQEPPDWLPGRPRPHHHHLKLILKKSSNVDNFLAFWPVIVKCHDKY